MCTLVLQEHLLKQGNVEQSPVAFLNQENSDNRLLVIIKNKDIAGHVHKVPLNNQFHSYFCIFLPLLLVTVNSGWSRSYMNKVTCLI